MLAVTGLAVMACLAMALAAWAGTPGGTWPGPEDTGHGHREYVQHSYPHGVVRLGR